MWSLVLIWSLTLCGCGNWPFDFGYDVVIGHDESFSHDMFFGHNVFLDLYVIFALMC